MSFSTNTDINLPRPTSHTEYSRSAGQYIRDKLSLEEQRDKFQRAAAHFTSECTANGFLLLATAVHNGKTTDPFHITHADRIKELLSAGQNPMIDSGGFKVLRSFLKSNRVEDEAFQPMQEIVESVAQSARDIFNAQGLYTEQTAVLRCTGTVTAQGDVPGVRPKPDARHYLLQSLSKELETRLVRKSARLEAQQQGRGPSEGYIASNAAADTACISEFKKVFSQTSFEDDARKILGGMNYLMYNDPARRHVYGLSMEANQATFWYGDRTNVISSKRFNYQENPELLIAYLLYLSFASTKQLGFDSTVTRFSQPSERPNRKPASEAIAQDAVYFVYDVSGDRYRTVGNPIEEDGAVSMMSRGIRVWLVQKVDNNTGKVLSDTPMHVIKDGWFWEDSLSEKRTQENIIEALPRSKEPRMRQLLMDILHDIEVEADTGHSRTLMPDSKATPAPQYLAKSARAIAGRVQRRETLNIGDISIPNDLNGHQHMRRVHRRVVFTEYCNILAECKTVRLLLTCVMQYVDALELFLQAGYVHRDINVYNCLFYVDSIGEPRPKLNDLEYCMKFDEVQHDDIVTRMMECSAIEVLRRRTRFGDSLERFIQYHCLYDLESLFWVLLWCLFSRQPCTSVINNNSRVHYEAWQELFKGLFNRDREISANNKELFICMENTVEEWLRVLGGLGWERATLEPICKFGENLQQAYKDLYAKPVDPESNRRDIRHIPRGIYTKFTKILHEVLDSGLADDGVELKSIAKSWENEAVKRERAETVTQSQAQPAKKTRAE